MRKTSKDIREPNRASRYIFHDQDSGYIDRYMRMSLESFDYLVRYNEKDNRYVENYTTRREVIFDTKLSGIW